MDSRFAFAPLGGAVLLLASLGQPVMAQSIWPEATAKFESSSSAGSGSRRSRTAREARSRARPRSGDATDKGPRVGVTGDFLWNAPEAGQRESGRLKARKKPAPGAERLVGRTFSPAGSGEWQWKITRTEWTEQDETAFGEFIRKIGESDCRTTHECLTSPAANPAYHATNPPGMKFFADCADLPFMLRGYFAWKNGLPFSYSTAISFHPDAQGRPSSAHGFQITGRHDVVPPGPDARIALPMISRLSTAHFRTPADYRGQFLPDHYPVGINRESIRAGTVIFDHLGHIAVVYKVTDDGRVHFIDAHPDNSLTRGTYDSEMERAGPETGSGFRRWRPQRLVGATIGPDGTLSGGTVELTADKDLPDWSDEQYFGAGAGRAADWRDARFAFNGQPIDYFGYVRMTLARPGFKFSPVDEVRARIDSMCQEIRYRVDAVDAAVRAGINRKPQPLRFPRNIYVTQGYWEAYATPSRDAQLKKMFKLLREEIERFIMLHDGRSTLVTYSGANLRADLRKVYETASGACAIAYTKSDGTSHKLTFADVKERLFKLSFDPHHCVELRWGASDPEELKSCPDGAVKKAWYDGQQRLRNQLVRTIGDRMDFTLADLARQAREDSDVGENEPPLVEVWTLLASAGID